MNLFRFLTPVRSAPVARERLGVLLEYDRHVVKQADLVAILREELSSLLGRHITFDPQKVRVKQIRGNAVCSVVVDIGTPGRRYRDGGDASSMRHVSEPSCLGIGMRPTLMMLEKDVERKIASLELRLRSRNSEDKRPLALAKGLQKLKRAAYYATKARAPDSSPLAIQLQRISARIQLHGLDAEVAAALGSPIKIAAAIEAETGEPVAQRVATAVEWFTKPHLRMREPR